MTKTETKNNRFLILYFMGMMMLGLGLMVIGMNTMDVAICKVNGPWLN